MMKKYLGSALFAVMVAASPAAAQTINFSSSGCTSGCATLVDSGVTFSTALAGSNLFVGNFGVQSDGNGLAVFNDADGNFLIGDLSFLTTSILLAFGNDDPSFTVAGDLARLQVFLAGTLVGTSQVVLNRDDILNQTIGFSGGTFDRFTFAFTNAAGAPFTGGGNAGTGLIEIVDNITFNRAAVPEPGTWAMMLLGFGAIGSAMRRRKPVAVRAVA